MTVAVVMDILLFPTLSIYLKSRAPGAKTYPQVIYNNEGLFRDITGYASDWYLDEVFG